MWCSPSREPLPRRRAPQVIGTVGAGRIGQRVLKRLRPFEPSALLYYDYARLGTEVEADLGVSYAELEDLVARCDVVTSEGGSCCAPKTCHAPCRIPAACSAGKRRCRIGRS
jgi:lactate dehydrogenase-like 2-hydroxyacid dehydrogenase